MCAIVGHGLRRLLVCTSEGLVRPDRPDGPRHISALLEEEPARCVAAGRGALLAGTRTALSSAPMTARADGEPTFPKADVLPVAT